jgi:hypothetical protein
MGTMGVRRLSRPTRATPKPDAVVHAPVTFHRAQRVRAPASLGVSRRTVQIVLGALCIFGALQAQPVTERSARLSDALI